MAKLSARGRVELARIKRGNTMYAAMSDWHVLRKHSWYNSQTGKKESSGWKVAAKMKDKGEGKFPENIYAAVERFVARMEKGGYERIVK